MSPSHFFTPHRYNIQIKQMEKKSFEKKTSCILKKKEKKTAEGSRLPP